jgi:hypothetical protein
MSDSAEIPAPVSEQTLFAANKTSQTVPSSDWTSICVITSGLKDTGMRAKTQMVAGWLDLSVDKVYIIILISPSGFSRQS